LVGHENAATTATVLVVDDESINLEIIEEFLSLENLSLCMVEDGSDAWERLEHEPELYDVVLLDRMMPGMDGMEILVRMKNHQKLNNIPVILQTAKASRQDIIEGISAGAYYYLTKPFGEELLRSIVRTAIEDKLRYNLLTDGLEQTSRGLSSLDEARFIIRTIVEANDVARILAKTCTCPAKAVIGISELLINAIEHGNLKIGYEEKTRLMMSGRWINEINKRLELPEYKHKTVTVSVTRQSNMVKILIEDEGDGFEWKKYLELDPQRVFDIHGRGIAIAKLTSFESINYFGSGNKVELLLQGAILS